jgi:hypothetical protein
MSDITIQSSNSTYIHKGANIFEGDFTVSGGVVSIGQNVETLYLSSAGWSSNSTMPAYGITNILSTTGGNWSTSPRLGYLAAPIPGVEKTIIVNTTAAYINTLDIDLGANCGIDGSTTNRFIAWSTLGTVSQSVKLVGLSTVLWGVIVADTTSGGWGVAAGIRSETAARTSG